MSSTSQETPSKTKLVPELPPDLRDFSALPDECFVRQPIVQRLFCCSAASIWRMVACKKIPAPKKLSSRITAWNVGELRQALVEKLEGGS